MNYQQKDWLGSWQNFESYLVSTAPAMQACWTQPEEAAKALPMFQAGVDRKSTRLNSSHRCISYAVFCLNKKCRLQRLVRRWSV